MNVVFIVLTVITAVLMIGIVLIQKSKGSGLSSSFGGGNQMLGVRGTNKFLEKATWTLAALILIFSVCSAYTLPKSGEIRAAKAQNSQPVGAANAFDNGAAVPADAQATPAADAQATPAPAPQDIDLEKAVPAKAAAQEADQTAPQGDGQAAAQADAD